MKPRYTLRQLAENDLEEIWLYSYPEWGIDQADKYIRALLPRFDWLSENPLIGKSIAKTLSPAIIPSQKEGM